ncbi:hypothetical protein HanXRQr2_Chr07g0303721 [Helianthus annuus]|uniref:Uncharacterized protein n=1 Tax=Helianthus annuus TaxID=4232 RepID=A0A9K3IMU8_HELAN|nr:hypothetical protein HanXRQr2_Chr07g0303721 [Helianthus annuus]KAJ0550813.1 hypothetical protein HanHA300_Chr07g0250151 [Helianthus annuus]KAJ0563781.1 hypothetical protein HanHA89_Chr07g0266981 [Helianthus annuus]KAJ0731857.1 hypothetical protein HanOQP8_Chr07g0256721 [Helianthus annuus]KAJ0905435.1 hypothetical protein HanPSC8_Chr07g0293991 [Helianthus annuus]
MISYIHRNTKMAPLFNRDLKPTFKRSSFAICRDLNFPLLLNV